MTHEIRLPKQRPPTLPGALLAQEFIEPTGLTVAGFARHIGVGGDRLSEIIYGRPRITPIRRCVYVSRLEPRFSLGRMHSWTTGLYEAQQSVKSAALRRMKPISGAA